MIILSVLILLIIAILIVKYIRKYKKQSKKNSINKDKNKMIYQFLKRRPENNQSGGIPEGFIESGNVFEVHLLKYKDPSIPQEKIDKFINFVKQDKLNLFTELIKLHKQMSSADVDDELKMGYTDKLDELPVSKLRFQLSDTEKIIFKSNGLSRRFWELFYNEYIRDVVPILQFRLLGTYWTDLAIQGSSQYRYYREESVKGVFELDMAQFSNFERYVIGVLDKYPKRTEQSYVYIGMKVGSRNLKNPKERPYVELAYQPYDINIQQMQMIIMKKVINFYEYLLKKFKVVTPFYGTIRAIKGFNFSYAVSQDNDKPNNLPAEEGDLKAIYDKWFNRLNPNLKYPDYYAINYLKTPMVVKQFNTQEEHNDWNKLP